MKGIAFFAQAVPAPAPTTQKENAARLHPDGSDPHKEIVMKHTKRAVEARTYSLAETAKILGFGRSTLQDHVRKGSAGHLHPVKLGRSTRFPKATIDALAEGAA